MEINLIGQGGSRVFDFCMPEVRKSQLFRALTNRINFVNYF